MMGDIENICTSCQTCMTAQVRRRHLKAKFDQNAPPSVKDIERESKMRYRDLAPSLDTRQSTKQRWTVVVAP